MKLTYNKLFNKRLLLTVCLFLIILSSSSFSQAGEIAEYKLKAAYLFNVMKFVSWDNETALQKKQAITLCIYKTNPFGHYLRPWSKKKKYRDVRLRS